MAYTKRLVESVLQTTRAETAGYTDDTQINRNLAMVESEIMETLAPLYSTNQKIQDLLAPFIEMLSAEPVVSGMMTLPSDYIQDVDANYNGIPMYKRNVNEVSILKTSATRKPVLDSGPHYCYFQMGGMYVLPDTIPTVDFTYIRKPTPGAIETTVVEESDRDYVTISVTKETEWPDRAFNLIYYHMLEKYGIDQQSQLAIEYSQLGIQRETSKL